MLHYEIIFPPPEQVEIRRKQLNDAGFQAWLSPILLLSTIYVSRFLIARAPVADQRVAFKQSTSLVVLIRRTSWMLNTTYLTEFGPLHVQATGALYISWLLFLIFRKTGSDYLHLTKAFGHVAVSQLPLQYLLAFKTPRSPITLATGLTHERLNAYHRLFGRIIHGLLGTHAILYLRFFLVKNLLAKRIQDRDVRLGIIAFWLINLMGAFALPVIRRKVYHNLFYRSHVFISALLVVILFFHVPYTRIYVLQAGIFWVANGIFRSKATEKTIIRCSPADGNHLLKATFNVEKGGTLSYWTPGQHVYLRRGVLGPRSPFTIVGTKEILGERQIMMTLVARNLGGPQTGALAQSAEHPAGEEVSVEGPYGEASEYMHQLIEGGKNSGRIVLLAGGVGATYTVPIYQHLLRSRGDTTGMKLIWLVQSWSDAQWGVEMLQRTPQGVDVDVYVTRESQRNLIKASAIKGIKIIETESHPEMTTILEHIIAPKGDRISNKTLVSNVKRDPRKTRRDYDKVTVLVCGPRNLSQSARHELGKHVVGHGGDIDWFEEQFGFGGS